MTAQTSGGDSGFVSMNKKSTLVEKMGGPLAMSGLLASAVEIFYSKLLGDPFIAYFFEGVDMARLMKKQAEFLAFVFGGPDKYRGKDIAEAHATLIEERGLNETHFDAMAGHFRDTLHELGVDKDLTQECVDIVLTARPIFDSQLRKEKLQIAEALKEHNYKLLTQKIKEIQVEEDEKVDDLKRQLVQMLHEKMPGQSLNDICAVLGKHDPQCIPQLQALLGDEHK
jgi:hemoglobin